MTSLAQDLNAVVRRGFAWWTGELASLLPKRLRGGLAASSADTVVAVHNGRLSLIAEPRGAQSRNAGSRTDAAPLTEQALLDAIARKSRPGRTMPVRLRLPFEACLVRRIEVPERARGDAASILALDMERSTPLNAADIYTSHYADAGRAQNGVIGFTQLIVKKSAIDGAIERLQSAGAHIETVECWSEDGRSVLPVNFLKATSAGISAPGARARRTALLLGSLTAALAVSAISTAFVRHQKALIQLEQQTAEARVRLSKLEAVKSDNAAAVQEAQSVLQLSAARTPVVRVLDELTQLLPDSAFLTEFSADGDTVGISGFAKRAAGLVPLLERSQMFAGATLSAPVTFDSGLDQERFSYSLRLRHPARPDAAAPPDTPETDGSADRGILPPGDAP